MCAAWEWIGKPPDGLAQSGVIALPDFPGYAKDRAYNELLVRFLHRLVSKADVILGHNVGGYDDKMLNTEFVKLNLPPPPPHKIIDTLPIAKRYFRFNWNSLGKLGEFLGLGSKVKHWGFELWERCMAGDPKAWALMKRYNVGDVKLLLKVYHRFLPWIRNHPNMNALSGASGCPTCKAKPPLLKFGGWNINLRGKTRRFRCTNCRHWCQGKETGKGLKKAWVFW